MIRQILASSRYFIAIAVVASFVAAVTLIIYGALVVGEIVIDTIGKGDVSPAGAKVLAVDFIEIIDVFLLGTVTYIIALGLYALFISNDLPMPTWLKIATLDDLKMKLLGVIIVLLAVTFLGAVVTWEDGRDIVYLGAGIGTVVLALALSLLVTHRIESDHALRQDHADQPVAVQPPVESGDSAPT